MTDKLEALSQPVAWTDAEELRDLEKHKCAYLFKIDPSNPYHDKSRQQMLYSQEYVTALIQRAEAAEQRLPENLIDSVCHTAAEIFRARHEDKAQEIINNIREMLTTAKGK